MQSLTNNMRTINKTDNRLLLLLVLLMTMQGRAQCSAGFNYTIGLNNSITFVSTCTPALANTTYSWTFGASYIPPVSGIGTVATQASPTYTSNGNFIVSITMMNAAPFCQQTFTAAVTLTTCTINFNASSATGSLCTGAATAIAQGFCGPVTYSWTGLGIGAIKNNMCPGAYTVIAAGSNPSCCPQAAGVVVINTVSPCSLNASFSRSLQANGLVNFSSTSTGTTAGSQYLWTFGDNTNGTGLSTSHTYSAPGSYLAFLSVINNSISCFDTSNSQIITPAFCNISTSASAVYSASNAVVFTGNATGTFSNTTYTWLYGDGTVGAGLNSTHSYSAAGIYTVTFRVNNNTTPACRDSFQLVINSTCALNTNFTHTVLANGLVNFNAGSSSSVNGLSYLWDFGDGFGDIAFNPVHQYTNGGTHYVRLKIARSGYPVCRDSVSQAINITGIACSANAQFILSPSGIPQQWTAVPVYPYNVSTAVWNWGDGSSSTGMYPSHTYSSAGNYSICLSVTLSCNATATYCTNQYLSKAAGSGMILVNVQRPLLQLGIAAGTPEINFNFYPNPNNGHLSIQLSNTVLPGAITVYDLSGRLVAGPLPIEAEHHEIDLMLPAGFYLLTLKNSQAQVQKKMLVE